MSSQLLCLGPWQPGILARPTNQIWSEEERRPLVDGLNGTRDLLQAETAALTSNGGSERIPIGGTSQRSSSIFNSRRICTSERAT